MSSSYPFTYDSNLESMVLSLTAGKSKEEAFEALTNWVSHNVAYDHDLSKKLGELEKKGYLNYGEPGLRDSLEVFNQRKGICCESSYLLVTMARIVGVNAEFVRVSEDLDGDRINHACAGAEINGKYILADPVYKKFDITHRKFKPASAKRVIRIFRKANGSYNKADDNVDDYIPEFIGTRKTEPEEVWDDYFGNHLYSVAVKQLESARKKIIKTLEEFDKKIADNNEKQVLSGIKEKLERRLSEYSQKRASSDINSNVQECKESLNSADGCYSKHRDYNANSSDISSHVLDCKERDGWKTENNENCTNPRVLDSRIGPANPNAKREEVDGVWFHKMLWPAVIAASLLCSFAAYKIDSYMKTINEQHQARIEYILKR